MFTDHIHKSERLIYEAIDPEQDLVWFQELRSDPSVAQWQKPVLIVPWSKAQAKQNLVFEDALVQVVIKLPNDKDPTVPTTPIGFLRLVSPGKGLEHHQRAGFSISLRPVFQGKGFGTEAVNWLVTIGFQRANLYRIEGSYNMGNIPAEKCYTKLGFKVEGIWRKHTWADGEWVDIVNIAMLRSEWEQQQYKGEALTCLQTI